MKNIIFYSTPAFGHINPAMPIIHSLVKKGYHVIFYSSKEFQDAAENCGAEFREYNFVDIVLDTQVGSHIPELTALILRFTENSLDRLIEEAKKLSPVLILHDTLAFWGRASAQTVGIRAVSVNTLITVRNVFGKSFWMYTLQFSGSSIKEIRYLPQILKSRKNIRTKYNIHHMDILGILMNDENFNIYTFPRLMHPDGKKFGDDCFFLGPSALLRNTNTKSTDNIYNQPLVYVSLGTVFNGSDRFWEQIFSEFDDTEYSVLISCGKQYNKLVQRSIPQNITVKSYVNQRKVLESAVLFITAGGMNSICEAAASGVPCLLCPQQGEQLITAKMFEKVGLGKVYNHKKSIKHQADQLIREWTPDRDMISCFNTIRLEELTEKLC